MIDKTEFDIEHFLKITFDIMGKVVDDFESERARIIETYKDDVSERSIAFRSAFRSTMGKYQGELVDKYGISFSEYNQDAAIYKLSIEEYLENKPDVSERYYALLGRIRMK